MEDLGQKLDALQSIILSLEARVSKIDAQVEAMDDDIGEADVPIVRGGGDASSGWSGIAVNFYGFTLLTVDVTDPEAILGKYICYHTGLSPTKHASGVWPKGASSGAWYWDTTVRGSPWMAWEVGGDEIKDGAGNSYTPKRYALAMGKTVGDIHIPVPIPTAAYKNIQLGAGTGTSTTDNGILGNYVRAH